MNVFKNPAYYVAAVVFLCLSTAYYWTGKSEQFGSEFSFMFLAGAVFGVILQRSRFCFFCIFRDLFELKDGRPDVGLLTALVIGSIGYLVLFGNWIPDPSTGYLPQDAYIGPVSWHLPAGGLLFGWGMALSGSCISAHLYRLGEGSLEAPFALAGTVAGFMLGFETWNSLYVATISSSSVIWLPELGGYTLWAIIQIAVLLGLMAWLLIRFGGNGSNYSSVNPSFFSIWQRIFVHRWPTWVGGIGVGMLSFFTYLRVEPLGVTAEIGRYSRELGTNLNVIPARLEGLDGLAGCSTAVSSNLLTTNGIFVLVLIAGSLFTALLSDHFRFRIPSLLKAVKSILGGILLGFGAMISLGCTIGTTLSGISAFAVSGWVFTVAMVVGVLSGIHWGWRN